MNGGAFRVEVRDGIAEVAIDVADERQNIIKAAFIDQAGAVLDDIERRDDVRGAVFYSAKPGSFIAGADVRMLADCADAAAVSELSRRGQAFCDRVAGCAKPLVAAIDGVCLGGGLEFALACHARVCSDAGATRLGLPEVQLGLLPGSGGTQRLPRLVGAPAALDLMLTGRRLRPAQARRIGLVDEVTPAAALLTAARRRIDGDRRGGAKTPRSAALRRWAFGLAPARRLIFAQARRRTLAKTHGNYPAPERIIDCVEIGLADGMARGLAAEAEYFGELSQTPQARQLMNLYFATVEIKKDPDAAAAPRAVDRVGVLGAGLMGAGIAYVSSADAGVAVRLKDRDAAGLSRGLRYIRERVQRRLRRRALSPFEAAQQQRRVTPTLDYSGFDRLDLVIEAVFEDLALKRQTLAEVERHAAPDTIFASNTSSIPIASIAADAGRPQQVIGMHYFSPVEKMPLLEVIAGAATSAATVATAVAFGRRQGKTVIVVKDSAGFYVNRILAPYINEAGHLLAAGVPIDVIDRALLRYGFPVGPFALLDEVGIDVGSKVGPILADAFGERMAPPAVAQRLVDDGRLGKKSGRGFYLYDGKKTDKGKKVDAGVYALLGVTPVTGEQTDDDATLAERCVLPLLNEAARCLDENVIGRPLDGDIGAVFGIGYPPFRGGPFRHIDAIGVAALVARLDALAAAHGARFEPCAALRRRADCSPPQSYYATSAADGSE